MRGQSVSVYARPRHRHELAAVLIGGALGAGAVLLASRQDVARVILRAPRPLPDTVTAVTAQDVRPAIAALAVAALASLAAVIATRSWLRRLTGLVTSALGVGIATIAAGQVTTAAAVAAAGRSGGTPASGSGAGTAAGSVTAGNGAAGPPGSLGGLPVHVVLEGSGWRAVMIAGAVLIAASGIVVIARASRLPAMSGRYDRAASRPAGSGSAGSGLTGSGLTGSGLTGSGLTGSGLTGSGFAGREPGRVASAATAEVSRPGAGGMWDALSAGSDPTAGPE